MICPIGLEVEKSTRVAIIAYYTMEKNTKTWISAHSVKLHGTKKGHQMMVPRREEAP
jgi:hypothetical protein